MRKRLLLLPFILFFHSSYTQYLKLSVYAEVSIITVGAGENLYEVFGHSTIRIKDPVLNFDIAYNYGVFDFNAPDFYSNFAKGKLVYFLARYHFQTFLDGYKADKRWIKEQILDLTQEQKQAFFEYLEHNARPENASYLYDPYFNNCATKLRDITKSILKDNVTFYKAYTSDKTLRQLMNDELYWNTWGSFGIHLALGTKLDKIATPTEYLYLPDFVFLAFEKGKIKINGEEKPLVKKQNDLLIFDEPVQKFSSTSPLIIFSVFLLVGWYITFRDKKSGKRSKKFDFILFFTTGVIGIGIVFLWFFTNHYTTPNNFNMLWAFAPNLLVAFYLLKNEVKGYLKKYVYFISILLLILIFFWTTGIQLFSIAAIPLLLLLGVRYFYLLTYKVQ
ncbi:MAG: DUF4105 domain-containing protein [Flavobacteriaceae bacterium]|nr:MAG: DUF4105 domain-containing protein [Flavobacteriaceae bacterium]